jgi:hypothetical protein
VQLSFVFCLFRALNLCYGIPNSRGLLQAWPDQREIAYFFPISSMYRPSTPLIKPDFYKAVPRYGRRIKGALLWRFDSFVAKS